MIAAIADTHAAIWYLFSDPRLGAGAIAFMNATRASGDHVGVSAISLAEMVYLIEKGRIPEDSLDALLEAIADPNLILRLVPVDDGVVLKMKDIPRAHVPDLPDRIVAATALHFNVPVLSRDGRITSSAVNSIW